MSILKGKQKNYGIDSGKEKENLQMKQNEDAGKSTFS